MDPNQQEMSLKQSEEIKDDIKSETIDNTDVVSKESVFECSKQDTQDGCEEDSQQERKKEITKVDTETVSGDITTIESDEKVSGTCTEEKSNVKCTEENPVLPNEETQGSIEKIEETTDEK